MSTRGTSPAVAISEYLRNGMGPWLPGASELSEASTAAAPSSEMERGGSARFDIWLDPFGISVRCSTIAGRATIVFPVGSRAAPVRGIAPPLPQALAIALNSPAVSSLMNGQPVKPPGRVAMAEAAHIIVVDDEPEICEMLADYLGHAGFRVSTAGDGVALRRLLEDQAADLVILDINMPGEDGLSLARYLRANTKIGIVMLTAAGEVVDRIVGLEMGADDYLPKPVDMRELLARVRAVLRRMEAKPERAAEAEAAGAKKVCFGACQLDLDAHRLYDAAGEEVPITSMEYDLLKAFAEHPNRVLSRDQLLDLAHNRDWEPFDRSIDIRIARLRRKVEADPSKPQVIKTVRGAGYIFVPGGEGAAGV